MAPERPTAAAMRGSCLAKGTTWRRLLPCWCDSKPHHAMQQHKLMSRLIYYRYLIQCDMIQYHMVLCRNISCYLFFFCVFFLVFFFFFFKVFVFVYVVVFFLLFIFIFLFFFYFFVLFYDYFLFIFKLGFQCIFVLCYFIFMLFLFKTHISCYALLDGIMSYTQSEATQNTV